MIKHSGGEQKVALFSLVIFSTWAFNSSLLRFRAAHGWQVHCFFVANDHFSTYQKAGTRSMKCDMEYEAPIVLGNSVVNSG